MLVGTILYQRYYSAAEYVCMTLVGLGVALFGSKSSRGVTAKLVAPNQTLGYALCGLNLLCDGFTNVKQVRGLLHRCVSVYCPLCAFWYGCAVCVRLLRAR